MSINIAGIDKAVLLVALYNAAKVQGSGYMDPNFRLGNLSIDEAKEILERGSTSFDYLHGRVMKIDIGDDEMEEWFYDRDNGDGKAQSIVDSLR